MKEFQWQLAHGELDESIHHTRKYIVAARGFGLQSNILLPDLAYNDALSSAAPGVGYAVTDSPPRCRSSAIRAWLWAPIRPTAHGGRTPLSCTAARWPSAGRESAGPATKTDCSPANRAARPRLLPINVAVGNTLTEALAALVAQHNNRPDEARILEGFLLSSLADLEQPDGRARLDVLLHSTAFASHRRRIHH